MSFINPAQPPSTFAPATSLLEALPGELRMQILNSVVEGVMTCCWSGFKARYPGVLHSCPTLRNDAMLLYLRDTVFVVRTVKDIGDLKRVLNHLTGDQNLVETLYVFPQARLSVSLGRELKYGFRELKQISYAVNLVGRSLPTVASLATAVENHHNTVNFAQTFLYTRVHQQDLEVSAVVQITPVHLVGGRVMGREAYVLVLRSDNASITQAKAQVESIQKDGITYSGSNLATGLIV